MSGPRETSGDPIRLHSANAVFDLGLKWWRPTVQPVYQVLVDLGRLDFSSPAEVGRRLRPLAARLRDVSINAEELVAFLDEFDQRSVPGQLSTHLRCAIGYVAQWLLSITDDRPEDDRHRRASELAAESWADTFVISGELLEEIEGEQIEASREDILEHAFGVRPSRVFRHYAEIALSFSSDPFEQLQLANRQLRLVSPAGSIPADGIDAWLNEAVRVALQTFPLLTHRAAFLASRLIDRAYEVDENAATSLFIGFHRAQVSRIISNGQDAHRAYLRSQAGDDASLVEAYKKLSEGLLRPFGAFIVHLHAVAERLPTPAISPRPLLGDLESALLRTNTELAHLLTIGLVRPMRNAAAHDDVVVDTAGDISILANDGTLTPIDTDKLSYSRAVLESALTGVDVAAGGAVWRHLASRDDGSFDWTQVTQTAGSLEQMATIIARNVAHGYVTDLIPGREEVSMTLNGNASRLQLVSFLAALDLFLHPDTRRVLISDEEGNLAAEYIRATDTAIPRFGD